MNNFISEYLSHLQQISNQDDIANLYEWFWHQSDEVSRTATLINQSLGLEGENRLQPDLPCLAIGGLKGVLILSANPGWREDLNALEDSYCRLSPEKYTELMFRFFKMHPEVVGERIKWWNTALSWVQLLDNWESRFGDLNSGDKWDMADQTSLIGGWELFPFHSSKDGMSSLMGEVPWLRRCAIESVKAAIRVEPEVLFVASKRGWQFIRLQVLDEANWLDASVGSDRFETSISYARLGSNTEVITIARQIFAAPRNFTNEEVFSQVQRFREQY